jgi:2-polyprenyl-6-methoxyphenol hydroxylase-like FAD-dependent oxidoreductase
VSANQSFDVIVVGGGIAGSAMAGVLAKAGLGVLLVERESTYRDRIRGEIIWGWGVSEARRLGLDPVLERAGRIVVSHLQTLQDRAVSATYEFPGDPMTSFPHPRLQAEMFLWAEAQGARTMRPAKAVAFARNGSPEITVVHGDRETTLRSRLVIGADGKTSAARRWAGGMTMSDPEHHRFGGVLTEGLRSEPHVFANASIPEVAVLWFAVAPNATRLYLRLTAPQLRETAADRSFDAFLACAAPHMPASVLEQPRQIGPLGFFSNRATWASHIAAAGIVLIGDAAGSSDPTHGLGTSLLFRDVRELSELLAGNRDWEAATAEFARRRSAYFAAVRALDLWYAQLSADVGPDADRRRERHEQARELDPTLGGFTRLEEVGPDGLVPDEAARRHFFGEDLD